ncbi:hypothetical protein EMIT0347P_10113 [Pseudomonas sp. IT-347P]
MSLLAIAECQSLFFYLIHRYREQAHSYRGFGLQWDSSAAGKKSDDAVLRCTGQYLWCDFAPGIAPGGR